jgi:hypothetical protein
MMFSLMRQKKEGGDIGELEAMLERMKAERWDWIRANLVRVAAIERSLGLLALIDPLASRPVV